MYSDFSACLTYLQAGASSCAGPTASGSILGLLSGPYYQLESQHNCLTAATVANPCMESAHLVYFRVLLPAGQADRRPSVSPLLLLLREESNVSPTLPSLPCCFFVSKKLRQLTEERQLPASRSLQAPTGNGPGRAWSKRTKAPLEQVSDKVPAALR